jgi:transcriptional regulator with XRE-family HTH domain
MTANEPSAQIMALRLRRLALRPRLTQDRLARSAGTTAAYISQIERGQRSPSLELIGKLELALERFERVRSKQD